MSEWTMVAALNEALIDATAADESVVVFGEDVGRLGGVFRVTDGIQARFGPKRCFDTPLAESGIVGLAVGLALRGFRPVPEIQFDAFTYPAFEQIVSHLAKYRSRTQGRVDLPVTLRVPSFGGVGAPEHHSESPETYLAHTAGLKVVIPSTPADAYALLRESIELDDPVVFLEPKSRYWQAMPRDVPTGSIGRAVVRRPGRDVTIVSYGPTVATALSAADVASELGWDIEVIDLCSLVPLDMDSVVASVERTGRCVVVHEAPRTLGPGAEIAALVQERAFLRLRSPVLRATGFDTPYPPARTEGRWLPDVERVLGCVEQAVAY
jgi:2-oxoisovalerate dehydrogenase E1 component beta subunit